MIDSFGYTNEAFVWFTGFSCFFAQPVFCGISLPLPHWFFLQQNDLIKLQALLRLVPTAQCFY